MTLTHNFGPNIRYDEVGGRIVVVTIDRPEARNAFTPEMRTALDRAMDHFERDDATYVAVVTGAGERAFCAGADLKVSVPAASATRSLPRPPTERVLSGVTKPVVAAINGACIGGGLELALATDIRIAANHAVFALSEVRWGIIPGGGGCARIPRQIPWAIAMEMLLTGAPIDAQRAMQVGLVNRVTSGDRVLEAALEVATVIAQNAPLAVRAAKRVAQETAELATAFAYEAAYVAQVLATEDAREGPRAFAERRYPTYEGK